MIIEEIQAIFDFIDYLESRKQVLIEKYIPLCEELEELRERKDKLKPDNNYREKRQYDILQEELELKFEPLLTDVYQPITGKLKELGISPRGSILTNIKNNISSFHDDDVARINHYKKKYLSFRNDTSSNFLTLQLVFSDLDESFKELFDYFKDTDDDELEPLEPKTIECSSIEEALKLYNKNPKENIRFVVPLNNTINGLKHSEGNTVISKSSLSELSKLVVQLKEILPTPASESIETSYEEALSRVNALKHLVENEDCYRLFDSPHNQNEAFFQYLFKITCGKSTWDINSEVNNGRGPVDFTISKGAADKTLVEFKLAKSTSLKPNLEHQVGIYKKANNTRNSVIAILHFTDAELKKTKGILDDLGLNGKENVILIDGRKKLSASLVRESNEVL